VDKYVNEYDPEPEYLNECFLGVLRTRTMLACGADESGANDREAGFAASGGCTGLAGARFHRLSCLCV
jgi:hypothetical protein